MRLLLTVAALSLLTGCALAQQKSGENSPIVMEGAVHSVELKHGLEIVKADPMFVPAKHVIPKCKGGCVPPPDYWTCADQKRVMLSSEDDSIHVCMKLSEEK